MSITPNVPQPDEGNSYQMASTPRWVLLMFIVAFLAVGGVVYAGYASQAELAGDLAAAKGTVVTLSKELEETNARLAQLRDQLDIASRKLGLTQNDLARARALAQQIEEQQKQSDTQLGAQIGQVKQATEDSQQKIGQVSSDLGGAKNDIAATRKDLEDTKTRLTSTVGDLGVESGLIAHNIDDVQALKRLNDRNIYDFNVAKSKNATRVGPIQIALQSTDPKHYQFTLNIIADDKAVQKKDRNIEEPMQFYVRGAHVPYEIVVFEVTKDHVTGYLDTQGHGLGGGCAFRSSRSRPRGIPRCAGEAPSVPILTLIQPG